jgi:hypothetical protein
MKAIYAHVSNIKAFPSQGTARVELEIPIESYRAVVEMVFNMPVLVTIAPAALKDQPYGVVEAANDGPPAPRQAAGGSDGGSTRVGALCLLAAQWCKEPAFWRFLGERFQFAPGDEAECAEFIREKLEIGSRKELDSNEDAGNRFKAHFRLPFMDYLRGNNIELGR